MFLRIVFESIDYTILVLSENCSCYLNLGFFVKHKKKLGTKCAFPVFLVLLVFENKKQFSKQEPNRPVVPSTF